MIIISVNYCSKNIKTVREPPIIGDTFSFFDYNKKYVSQFTIRFAFVRENI